jgi:hypothetical protein
MATTPKPYDSEKAVMSNLPKYENEIADQVAREINITGPMAFWISMLCIGMLLQFVFAPLAAGKASLSAGFLSTAKYILYLPGSLVFPLIVSVWAGSRIGYSRRNINAAAKTGLLNGIYMSIIYAIAIIVIYLLISYISPHNLPVGFTLQSFLTNLMAIPVAVVIVLTTVMTLLSSARHSQK